MSIKTLNADIFDNIDGSNTVFSLPQEYIPGSVSVSVVNTVGGTSVPGVIEELGGVFFTITTAPTTGHHLRCSYQIEVMDGVEEPSDIPVLSRFEQKNINALIGVIQKQNELIKAMDVALKERVTRKEFDKWASAIEVKLTNLSLAYELLKSN